MRNLSRPAILHLTGKMKRRNDNAAHRRRSLRSSIGLVTILVLIAAAVFFTGSLASTNEAARRSLLNESDKTSGTRKTDRWSNRTIFGPGVSLAPPQAPPAETVQTFDTDCATPKTDFNLGDTVCAKVSNSAPNFRRFNWAGTKGYVRQATDISSDPQTDTFTLPATNTSIIDGEAVDNRGIWTVSSNSTLENNTRAIAYFNVSDPANAAADLVIYNFSTDSDPITPGSSTGFFLWLSNPGPDSATNVHVTQAVPPNMSFVSASTSSAFACAENNGVVDCSLASWASGAVATITLNYSVSGAAPNGVISSTADISSDVNDPRSASNSANAEVEVRAAGGAPATCALGCPADIIATADTTQGTQSGTFVTFTGSVEVSGDCGTLTFTPASGSFFAVGTTPVNVTSGTGGGSCNFTVTVLGTAAPTISCPSDVTVQAPSGQLEATVTTGTPTATGTGVSISGIRNDNRDVTDPYPIGTTTITWRATDSDGRVASCFQHITVTSADAPTITCPTDRTFTAAAGECQKTVLAEDIGLPSTTGANVTVTNERSDDLNLTAPYPAGDTFITWTATNDLGSASCTQRIHINAVDNQPPVLTVPPNVSVTTNTCTALLDDELGVATATDNCTASVNIVRTGVPTAPCPSNPNGCETFVFPTGTTVITYTATDAAGNTATGTQLVTVTESPAVPPTITAPPNVSANTGPGATSCGTVVSDATLGTASASDNCPGVVVTRTGVPAGNNFPVGTTTVTYTATDKSGNTATATQNVTVVDNTPPVVTAPGPVTLFTGPGATSCGVTVSNLDVTLGTGSATDNCPGVGAVSRSGVPAGNNFPVGTTTVTYSATDAHGNTGSATQVVTVVDNTLPLITCPASITLEPTCPTGAIATYTAPVGTDNCPGATTARTAGLASGSVFPIGTNAVTYRVTDAAGNTASCGFTVTVLTPQAVIQNMINTINGYSNLSGTQKQGLNSKLQAALDAINQGKTNVACNKLGDFISQVTAYINNGTLTSAQGQALLSSANHVRNTIGCTSLPCS